MFCKSIQPLSSMIMESFFDLNLILPLLNQADSTHLFSVNVFNRSATSDSISSWMTCFFRAQHRLLTPLFSLESRFQYLIATSKFHFPRWITVLKLLLQTSQLSMALVVAFDITEMETVISLHETVALVSYLKGFSLCKLCSTSYLLHYTSTTDILSSSLYETHGQAFYFFPYTSRQILQHLQHFFRFGFLPLHFLFLRLIIALEFTCGFFMIIVPRLPQTGALQYGRK